MKRTLPGEIWRVDFGLAAKVRPALILSEGLKLHMQAQVEGAVAEEAGVEVERIEPVILVKKI
jgi:hypothetical protein